MYEFTPINFNVYNADMTFEENVKRNAVLTKENLDAFQDVLKKASAQFSVGSVTVTEAGTPAAVNLVFNELEGTRRFNFTIPKGDPGKDGKDGKSLEIKKTYDSVEALEAGFASDGLTEGDLVAIASTVDDAANASLYIKAADQYKFLMDLSGATGIQGPEGKEGKPGPAATITVGNVTTGPEVSITPQTEDSTNVVLDFVLAEGIKGEDGYTPQKGVDYFTSEDKSEIETEITGNLDPKIEQVKQDLTSVIDQKADSEQVTNDINTAKEDLNREIEKKADANQVSIDIQTAVDSAKGELNTKVDQKADSAQVAVDIQTAVETAKNDINNLLANKADANQVTADIANAKIEIEEEFADKVDQAAIDTTVEAAKKELKADIDNKVDQDTVDSSITTALTDYAKSEDVTAQIQEATADFIKQDAVDTAKAELEGKIGEKVGQDAVDTAVGDAKSELEAKIAEKVDQKAVDASVDAAKTELNAAITSAVEDKVDQTAIDTSVNAAKKELSASIEKKVDQAAVDSAIETATADFIKQDAVDTAKEELTKEIAKKADTDQVTTDIAAAVADKANASDLDAYLKKADIDENMSAYVKQESLTITLESYATTESVEAKLDKEEASTTYLKVAEKEEMLADYAKTSAIESTKDDLNKEIAKKADAEQVATDIETAVAAKVGQAEVDSAVNAAKEELNGTIAEKVDQATVDSSIETALKAYAKSEKVTEDIDVAKTELTEKITELHTPKKPYVSEDQKFVFMCGYPGVIEKVGSANSKISYYEDGALKSLTFPVTADVFGGGDGTETPADYPSTSITMNSGKVKNIIAGSRGQGNVGNATVIVNGGEATAVAASFTFVDNKAYTNSVGKCKLVFNGGIVNTVYGGTGSGAGANVDQAVVVVNDGNLSYVTLAGSNGSTGVAKGIINGGTIADLQGANRGTVGSIVFVITGGTVTKLSVGGKDEEDISATFAKATATITGGTVTNLNDSRNGTKVDKTKISGTYVKGTVSTASGKCGLTEATVVDPVAGLKLKLDDKTVKLMNGETELSSVDLSTVVAAQ